MNTLIVTLSLFAIGTGARPEISHVFPDFADARGFTHVITGENFALDATEIWSWSPPSDEETILQAMSQIDVTHELPAEPPDGAQKLKLTDVETQVIVAMLAGEVIWVKTDAGFSRPYLMNVARPFWITAPTARQGDLLSVYGFGLRPPYSKCRVALWDGRTAMSAPLVQMPREQRVKDPRLVHFKVPLETAPGSYDVFVHNSRGGIYGWRRVAAIDVLPAGPSPRKILDARQFGAKGDGLANDFQAIQQALEKAADKHAVVMLPPGVYRIDQTLTIPENVVLRGAAPETSVLEGYGYDPQGPRRVWHSPHQAAASPVIVFHDHTKIEKLTVRGAPRDGPAGVALIQSASTGTRSVKDAPMRDVTVQGCRLFAQEDMLTGRAPYGRCHVFHIGPRSEYVRFASNDVFGSVEFSHVTRLDLIDNRFHSGAGHGYCYDSLIDANYFVDSPTRFLFYPRRHNHIRFNEAHQAFRSSWQNAEEMYLVHGGSQKSFGHPASATDTTLTDASQNWNDDELRDATVLITDGRGFGQYRTVVDNTSDTLSLDRPWRVVPDTTSYYVVGVMHVENDLYANLNNTPLRLSLWLDCIGNLVDMHRDVFSKGSDIWGQDRSIVQADGTVKDPGRFHPAWYNAIMNCWMDGAYAHLWSGADPANIHPGPPMFANYVVGNKIRQPHMHRTGFTAPERSLAGILVGNPSGMEKHPGAGRPESTDMQPLESRRVAISHSIVANNHITFTPTGIQISDFARKTFILNNEFQEVPTPVRDWGARTFLHSNKNFQVDDKGERREAIPDEATKRDVDAWEPPEYSLPEDTSGDSAFRATRDQLRRFVTDGPNAVYEGVRDPARQSLCASNLKALFQRLQRYDEANDGLPKVGLYPAAVGHKQGSLAQLLGAASADLLRCPTCSTAMRDVGINYLWNESLGGVRLTSLTNPARQWLMMDVVAAHHWLVTNGHAGHCGGVNVLYADGQVTWHPPDTIPPIFGR